MIGAPCSPLSTSVHVCTLVDMTTTSHSAVLATATKIDVEEVWVNGLRKVATITLDNGMVLRTRPSSPASSSLSPLNEGALLKWIYRGDILHSVDGPDGALSSWVPVTDPTAK